VKSLAAFTASLGGIPLLVYYTGGIPGVYTVLVAILGVAALIETWAGDGR